ncbi:MAG: MFS transporter [Fibrobacteria bacterium]|nr:MFS transporter [Fibrobacteria bacterium]
MLSFPKLSGSHRRFAISTIFIFFGISSIQFHSVLFEDRGFTGSHFTLLIVTGAVSALVSPLTMSLLTRFFRQPFTPLQLLLFTSGITLPLLPVIPDLRLLLLMYFIHTFSMWGLFPLYLACGMEVYREKGYDIYFFVRSLGTFGFAVGCAIAAISARGFSFPVLYFGFGISFLLAFFIIRPFRNFSHLPSKRDADSHVNKFVLTDFFKLTKWKAMFPFLKDKQFLFLLVPITIICCANSMAVNIQGNYIINHFRGTRTTVSIAWLLCSGLEIPIMFFCIYLLRKWSLTAVLFFGVLGTCIRLTGMSYSPTIGFFFLSIALHGFYYAGVATGMGVCIDRTNWKHRAALQPLLTVIYSGIPNVTGAFLSGYIWEHYSLSAVYQVSLVLSWIGLILIIFLFPGLIRRFR